MSTDTQEKANIDFENIKEEYINQIENIADNFEKRLLENKSHHTDSGNAYKTKYINVIETELEDGKKDKAYNCKTEAKKLFREENYEAAEKKWREAISLDPSQDSYLRELSKTLVKLNRVNDALTNAQKAIGLKPDESNYAQLAYTFSKLGKFEDAISAIDKSIEQNEKEPWNYVNKAWYHRNIREYDEAIKSMCKAIEYDNNNPRHYILKADYHALKGDFDGAIELMLIAESKEKLSAYELFDLSKYYNKNNNNEKELEYVRKAHESAPELRLYKTRLDELEAKS